MIEILNSILTYISGLFTLPWILIGFIITWILSKIFDINKINNLMKKIGLIILYIFIPLLLFRIFLAMDFHESEIEFAILCFLLLSLMYFLAYVFASIKTKNLGLKGDEKTEILKTILTNQGRSSAFIGGAMLAIKEWSTFTAIYMSIGAIFLFAIIPYILSYLHKKDIYKKGLSSKIKGLPWFLKLYPWYLLLFAFTAIILHGKYGITISDFGANNRIIFTFFTQLTIPGALYYVGAGIHPQDLKIQELKKLFSKKNQSKDHWLWVRNIFFLTAVITPSLTTILFFLFLMIDMIPNTWFSVIVINSILPITSTNIFLVPYGINKRVTSLAVTWTTIICVPIVVILIYLFDIYL